MRILNVGSYGMYRISIDQHPFELVEVDDTAIHGPTGIHEVSVATGQRASIILSTDQGDVGSAYYLRANIVTGRSMTYSHVVEADCQLVLVKEEPHSLVWESCDMSMRTGTVQITIRPTPKPGMSTTFSRSAADL